MTVQFRLLERSYRCAASGWANAMKTAVLILAMVGFVGASAAEQETRACKSSPQVTGSCFTVRGRLSFWNGNPSSRIWPVGTKRMLGVREGFLPKELLHYVSGFDTELWGDFDVCPLTKEQPGHMQIVCIEGWKNINARQRR